MFTWFAKKKAPLKELPLSQREKSYSAASGFVYQYIFKGIAANHHVFSVSADRREYFEVAIEIDEKSLSACEARMGSPLRWNEVYALAKLCLFAAFDTAASPDSLRATVATGPDELLEHMTTLNMG